MHAPRYTAFDIRSFQHNVGPELLFVYTAVRSMAAFSVAVSLFDSYMSIVRIRTMTIKGPIRRSWRQGLRHHDHKPTRCYSRPSHSTILRITFADSPAQKRLLQEHPIMGTFCFLNEVSPICINMLSLASLSSRRTGTQS